MCCCLQCVVVSSVLLSPVCCCLQCVVSYCLHCAAYYCLWCVVCCCLQCVVVSSVWCVVVSSVLHIIVSNVLYVVVSSVLLSPVCCMLLSPVCCAVLQKVSRCCEVEAREALLKAIYRTDSLTPSQLATPISTHIQSATSMAKVGSVSWLIICWYKQLYNDYLISSMRLQ